MADNESGINCNFIVNSTDAWVNQVFSIDLTLKEILQNLDLPDLLNVSLLNKYFAIVSRQFMLENKRPIAVVKGERPCQVLKNLELTIEQAFQIPFNGLSITTTEDSHNCLHCPDIYQLFPTVLTKLDLKYLKVDWKWSLDTSCPAQQVLRTFLKQRCSDLKELTIRELPWGEFSGNYAFNQENPGTWLRNLKVLEFSADVEIDLIEKIIPCAPNLREIRGRVFPEHLKFLIPQRKLKLIRDFRLYPELSTTDLVAQFASEGPKLESMEISSDELRRDDASMETFKIILRLLLESGQNSLKRLKVEEHLDMLWFTHLNLPALQGVEELLLHYELELDRHLNFCSLTKINWDRLFPNLSSIEISLGITPSSLLTRYINIEALRICREHVCSTVTKLTLPDQGRYYRELYLWLATVFPNLKHLQIAVYMEFSDHLNAIFNCWPNLDTIFINFKTRSSRYNLDGTLAGISAEEAEELRDKDPKFVQSYQFASMAPSIFTMNKLQRLRISQLKHNDGYRSKSTDQNLVSELSQHLIFSKIPAVKVELSTRQCRNGQCLAF